MYPYSHPYSYYHPLPIHYQSSYPNQPYYPAYFPYRDPPKADPTIFMNSLQQTQPLLKNADLLLEKLAHSQQLSLDIMNAAQNSEHEKVNELIKSTGVEKV